MLSVEHPISSGAKLLTILVLVLVILGVVIGLTAGAAVTVLLLMRLKKRKD